VSNDLYENAMRQALGMDPLTANDGTVEFTDVGREKSIPVFSDKELKQELLWDKMNRASNLVDRFPSPAAQRELVPAHLDAMKNYYDSLSDPNLPANQRSARYDVQDTQAGVDANTIARAISNRARLGRK
jgi:hypothetical protein